MMSNHKAFYRRMGSMEEHLGGNPMSTALLHHQLKDMWSRPRVTVLRIEALALVAITLSFFLAFFGSCRRWSNRWIAQKGFLAAQVLSLSLGTYSIGLMQSSPVKSEMYPIWAVSLLTLFGCIDPVTTYIDLDYKGPLSKVIFQLCLYLGYVMLMSVSTISTNIGKLAIGVLSTITFIKGFHRALAFVLPGGIREVIAKEYMDGIEPAALAGCGEGLNLDLVMRLFGRMEGIKERNLPEGTAGNGMTIKDVCLSYSFSHPLRKRFLGLGATREMEMDEKLKALERLGQDGRLTRVDYLRAFKVVEVELAFLFDAFFTSNEFLHLYQAKSGSFWALASFIGICFVGVVAAIIPRGASHHNIINSAAEAAGGAGAGTSMAVNIVRTKTADQIITLVILVSLAVLQLVQLIRCWTSNWASIGIACDYAKAKKQEEEELSSSSNTIRRSINQIIHQWEMRLRLFLVARVNWFEKYLWQAKLGQDSLAALVQRKRTQRARQSMACCCLFHCPEICKHWLLAVGVQYFCRVISALLFSDTNNPGGAVSLHDDIKSSIAEFLGKIKSRRIGVEWSAFFVENGLQYWLEYLPYTITSVVPVPLRGDESEAEAFTCCVMIWHTATWYCEEADKAAGGNRGGEDSSSRNREKNQRVAMDLSRYCVYLVVSAPELLLGPATETKEKLDGVVELIGERNMLKAAARVLSGDESPVSANWSVFDMGMRLGQRLVDIDPWELLALVWVQMLLYAAPYGDVQVHMQRLAQGGEFITHLWALLFHLGIDKWEAAGINELKGGPAATASAETTTREQVQVQEDDGRCSTRRASVGGNLKRSTSWKL